jgi:hypothetical protein
MQIGHVMEKKESAKVLQMQTLSFAGPIGLTKSQPNATNKKTWSFCMFICVLGQQNQFSLYKYSGPHLKQTLHRKIQNDRRLGTVWIFTYYKNNLGWILNNTTSHGHIKQNRCQPW